MYDNTEYVHVNGATATAFYIGGEDPARVWPESEIQRIDTRWRLPIWVNSTGGGDPVSDGHAMAQWADAHKQPKGTCIAIDLEAAIVPSYVRGVDHTLQGHGFECVAYGSESSVLQNPKPSGGFWVAVWDGAAHCPPDWAAHQYVSDQMLGKPYDLSIVNDATNLWDSQAGSTPPPSAGHYTITHLPPGFWEGTVTLSGIGTDGNAWHTLTSDGAHWTRTARG
jgi:hypothetical protein